MDIKVLFFGQLRETVGTREEVISIREGSRLAELIERLHQEYGPVCAEDKLRTDRMRILINGREYSLLGGTATRLSHKDTVVFLPVIAGG